MRDTLQTFFLRILTKTLVNVNSGYVKTLDVLYATRTEHQGFWGTALGAVPQNPLNPN